MNLEFFPEFEHKIVLFGIRQKNENAKPADAGGDDKVTAVYKIDMHCEGCAKKIKQTIKKSEGNYKLNHS